MLVAYDKNFTEQLLESGAKNSLQNIQLFSNASSMMHLANLYYSGRQCIPVVRALALRSGDPGSKTRSDHRLNLFLVVQSLV